MPPVSPQGSRGGLITAVVIFTILFVTSTIFAIYYATALGKAEEKIADTQKRTAHYYGDVTSARFKEALDKASSDPNLPEKTAMAAEMKNTDDAVKAVMGPSIPTTQPALNAVIAKDDAIAKAKDALNKASVDAAVPDGGLVDALNYVTQVAVNQKAAADQASKDRDAAVAKSDSVIKDTSATIEAKTQEDAKKLAERDKAIADAQTQNQDYEKKLQDQAGVIDKERQGFNVSLQAAQNDKAELEKKLALRDKAFAQVTERLARTHPAVEEPIVRRPDGMILTVASDTIVYINLGQGDHIVPGMTFEVYSKRDGVPPLGDGMSDTDMPVGEASIEVQQINGASSQCRVTKLEPGQRIIQGDIIANLVYDRNIKYNFVVYGQFDLMQNGHPNPADADVIKSLIVQWGGKIQTDINVDTDFVVMGSEPKVETFTADQLIDAFTAQKLKDEQAAQKAYDDTIGKAKDLHIPIMNQNRFLYFCGYYDLATR